MCTFRIRGRWWLAAIAVALFATLAAWQVVPTLVPKTRSPAVTQHHLPWTTAFRKVLIGNDG